MNIRELQDADRPALQTAIDTAASHRGEWTVEHFISDPERPAVQAEVIENKNGPIAFVRFTKTLRISCVWANESSMTNNAKAVIRGIQDAVQKARASGFSEIVINTEHPKLAEFLERVIGMTRRDSDFLLAV
jgi:hypothetical protein